MIQGSNIAQSYALQALEMLKATFPDKSDDEIKKFIGKVVKDNFKDDNKVTIFNNYTDEQDETTLLGISKLILSESKPIYTTSGVLFHNHYNAVNNAGAMLSDLLQQRKDVKKMMFKVVNTDKILAKALDAKQKTIKVLNNSWYGVMGQSSFIFYNKILGPSITATAQTLITTSIMAFERFLTNSIKFKNFSEVLNYITAVKREEYKTSVNYNPAIINVDSVLFYLYSHTKEMNKKEYDTLKNILSQYDIELLGKLYYKNKFVEFLDLPEMKAKMSEYINTPFVGEDPSDELREDLNDLWSYLSDHVYYKELVFDRNQLSNEHIRESVIVIDTDSNFISLADSLEFIEREFKLDYSNVDTLISASNMLIYLLSTFIKKIFYQLTSNMNIPEDKRALINMKSEFLYDRLLLTNAKKSYAGILLAQEGTKLKKSKLDIKGLQIKKTTVNNSTRKYFMDILENDILKSNKVDVADIIKKFKLFENNIKESILSGSISFASPKKSNGPDSYVNPFGQIPLRGALLWNKLYPGEEIIFPASLNIFKLSNEFTLVDLKNTVENDEQFEIMKDFFFISPDTSTQQRVISIPKDKKEIPKWIIPLIDIATIQNDNTNTAITLLESLGVKTMALNINKKAKLNYSNIIF